MTVVIQRDKVLMMTKLVKPASILSEDFNLVFWSAGESESRQGSNIARLQGEAALEWLLQPNQTS